MAATPSPNLSDQQLLATDTTFQARVLEALIATCVAVTTEATTVSYHYKRMNFAVQTLLNIQSNPTAYSSFFAKCVATDATTLGAATAAGATPLTAANVAAQAAQIPDNDILNALSSQFNSFFVPT